MAANFAFFLNFASFFLLPLLVKNLGGRETAVGTVMGSAGVATLLTLPILGQWIDRMSRRRLFTFGALNMTVAALGYLLVDQIDWRLLGLRLWQGISFAAAFTAATTLAAELAPAEHRGRALGWFGVSTLLTHALAPALGEEVLRRWGFPTLFVLAAACSLLGAALIQGVPERQAAPAVAGAPRGLPLLHYGLGIVVVLFGMGFGVVVTYAASYVQAEQLGRVGAFFASYTSAAIAVRMFAGGLSDRFGRRAVVVPALALLGLSVGGLAWVHSTVGLALMGLLFGFAQGVAYPAMHAFLVDVSPKHVLGRAQALFNGAFNLGVMSSAFLFGPLADHWGQRAMFFCAAWTPWGAAFLFLALATKGGWAGR